MTATTSAVRAPWVITMDGGSNGADVDGRSAPGVLLDGAVVFDDTGIVQVGPASEVLSEHPSADVEHLEGHAVMPGLVNAHTHLAMTMFRGIADDRHLEDFLATVLPMESGVLNARNVRSASRAALVESHLAGVTTSLDMYFFCDSVLEAAAEVGARVLTGPVLLDRAGPDGSDGPWQNRLEGAADWLAGHGSRSDWSPVLGPHSTYTVSPDHLLAAGQLARDSGALLHLHAAETEAEINTVLDAHGRRPVELLDHLELLGPRTILAHGVHLTRAEMDRLAETGTRVVHCPGSNLKLASGIAPVRSLLRDGVAVALGTDGAASSNHLDVLAIMRLTALVHKTCAPEGADAASLPAAQALAMGTRTGAEVLGLGDRLGVLRPGASADLVAIDLARVHTQPVQDVCSAMVYTADRGDVTDVWSDGRRVVRAGVHQLVSEAEVVADLRALGEIAAGWG